MDPSLVSPTPNPKIIAARHPYGATLCPLRLLAYPRKRLESNPNKLLEPAAARGLTPNRHGREAANRVGDGCGRREATAVERDRMVDAMSHSRILIALGSSTVAVLDEFKTSKRSEHS